METLNGTILYSVIDIFYDVGFILEVSSSIWETETDTDVDRVVGVNVIIDLLAQLR